MKNVTITLEPALPIDQARTEIRALFAWRPHALGSATIEQAWGVQTRYRFNWRDALISAAAQLSGCEYLLTEDLQSGQEIDGLKVMTLFEHQPDALRAGWHSLRTPRWLPEIPGAVNRWNDFRLLLNLDNTKSLKSLGGNHHAIFTRLPR